MGVPSTVRRTLGRARRLIPLASALLLAAMVAATVALTAQAQDGDGLTLVNHDRDFVERERDSQAPRSTAAATGVHERHQEKEQTIMTSRTPS